MVQLSHPSHLKEQLNLCAMYSLPPLLPTVSTTSSSHPVITTNIITNNHTSVAREGALLPAQIDTLEEEREGGAIFIF